MYVKQWCMRTEFIKIFKHKNVTADMLVFIIIFVWHNVNIRTMKLWHGTAEYIYTYSAWIQNNTWVWQI